ncbi:MAG: hypothetical protein K2K75_12805 [Muribaculaceae bacterium]|nr:hypothetical protein [Muribaculaceae bacterium]
MPNFKVTSKVSLGGSNGIPKGTTVRVITPSGICDVNAKRIQEAIKQQLGKDIPYSQCVASHFIIEKL